MVIDLFVRRTKPLKLFVAGIRMLKLADRIFPKVEAAEDEFRDLLSGKTGHLQLAIECHACIEWLFPVLESDGVAWPDVDLDIHPRLAFDALLALAREEVNLVVSSDPKKHKDFEFSRLFDCEPVFVAPSQHILSKKQWIEAQDFWDVVLIIHHVDRPRLDLFSQLLIRAMVQPRSVLQIELTLVTLIIVVLNCGVAVLPEWVVREARYNLD